ncbi:MAG: zinc ABC transporter substrate-binding protein, partial [Rhodospirillales bacterium]
PELLLKGNVSPHDFSLKPSQAKNMREADLIVWVGPQFESFMAKPVASLGSPGRVLSMAEVPGMEILEPREGGAWETHGHGHDHGPVSGLEADGHLWLDIGNAKRFAEALAAKLSAIDPSHAARYRLNASALNAGLDRLDGELKKELAPLSAKPYVVFHDAFQYFERRYGLNPLGSITMDERKPSAKTIAKLRRKLVELKAGCVYREPQASARPAEMLAEGLNVRIGTLDDLGSRFKPGPDLYPETLRDLAASLKACLE